MGASSSRSRRAEPSSPSVDAAIRADAFQFAENAFSSAMDGASAQQQRKSSRKSQQHRGSWSQPSGGSAPPPTASRCRLLRRLFFGRAPAVKEPAVRKLTGTIVTQQPQPAGPRPSAAPPEARAEALCANMASAVGRGGGAAPPPAPGAASRAGGAGGEPLSPGCVCLWSRGPSAPFASAASASSDAVHHGGGGVSAHASERASAVAKARSVGASIALQMDALDAEVGGEEAGSREQGAGSRGRKASAERATFEAFRSYEDGVEQAASAVLALCGAPALRKLSPVCRVEKGLRMEEALRVSTFEGAVRARDVANTAQLREGLSTYALLCDGIVAKLGTQLTQLPPPLARAGGGSAMSTYLSRASQHGALASRVAAEMDVLGLGR